MIGNFYKIKNGKNVVNRRHSELSQVNENL